MSLTVPPDLLEQAQRGKIDNTAFLACIRDSLPFAWSLVSDLARRREATGAEFVDNQVAPPDEAAYGQLFRALASTSIRKALEDHFGVRLAFQNCHRVAVFPTGDSSAYRTFVTAREQILNQSPELRDC